MEFRLHWGSTGRLGNKNGQVLRGKKETLSVQQFNFFIIKHNWKLSFGEQWFRSGVPVYGSGAALLAPNRCTPIAQIGSQFCGGGEKFAVVGKEKQRNEVCCKGWNMSAFPRMPSILDRRAKRFKFWIAVSNRLCCSSSDCVAVAVNGKEDTYGWVSSLHHQCSQSLLASLTL